MIGIRHKIVCCFCGLCRSSAIYDAWEPECVFLVGGLVSESDMSIDFKWFGDTLTLYTPSRTRSSYIKEPQSSFLSLPGKDNRVSESGVYLYVIQNQRGSFQRQTPLIGIQSRLTVITYDESFMAFREWPTDLNNQHRKSWIGYLGVD